MQEFDIAIIGSGPGGYRAAVLAALRGRKVAIIERDQWGGCCLNRGCVPKKVWHHTALLVAHSRRFGERGIRGSLAADLDGAWAHQARVVASVQRSYLDYLARLGVTAIEGRAHFVDASTLAVEGASSTRLRARHIVIAAGSRPAVPPALPPLAGRVLTTDMLFDQRPPAGNRVAVVGGGVVATEFAFILSMLGKDVLWLCRRAPLVDSLFSQPALRALAEGLEQVGVAARVGAGVASANTDGQGLRLGLDDGGEARVDWVLLGTGRTPNTDPLRLERVGVARNDQGFVVADDFLETTVPGVYAIGDCVAGAPLTANQALADAALVVGNIIEGKRRRREPLWVPEVVYSAVELARVGMNDDLAEAAGREPAVGFSAFEASPRALGQDDSAGFVRILADMDDGRLLGGEVVGAEAGELIHLLALAPDRATALHWLAQGRFNHPARAEELLNATETLASKWGLGERVFKSGA